MPDIPIPQLSVHIETPGMSARVTETTVTRIMRNQLLQITGLDDISSISRNGGALITVTLKHGSNMDLAFIEANEKVDYAMSFLRMDLPRPRVVKGSLSDIPVFYLALIPESPDRITLSELSSFTEQVVKRRLEQQAEVSFVDMHGLANQQISVKPDLRALQALNLFPDDLSSAIMEANMEVGNIVIAEGQYEFQVSVGNRLANIRDVKDIIINTGGRLFTLGDIAEVSLSTAHSRGSYLHNGKEGILLSIRKKYDANNFELKKNVGILMEDFRSSYPNIDFIIVDDQSSILELSYKNLRTALLYGIIFSSIVLFLFFREWRLPLMIILTVPISVLLSLMGFYLLDVSMNIISISGLILGVGLMIDNGIIIIDNIRQEQQFIDKDMAITKGTADVFRPLLSSALTTISVFMPLILLGGIAGVLFYDQAISISIALTSSLIVSVILIPVLARIIIPAKAHTSDQHGDWHHQFIGFVLAHRWKWLVLFVVISALGILLVSHLKKEGFPALTVDALEIDIDWNENLSIQESERRIRQFEVDFRDDLKFVSAIIGEQQFVIREEHTGMNEVRILAGMRDAVSGEKVKADIRSYFTGNYPKGQFEVFPKRNTFDRVLVTEDYDLIGSLRSTKQLKVPEYDGLTEIFPAILQVVPGFTLPPEEIFLRISVREEVLLNYNLSFEEVRSQLLVLFNQKSISDIRGENKSIPIMLGVDRNEDLDNILRTEFVRNRAGRMIPFAALVQVTEAKDYKYIHSNAAGEYIKIPIIQYYEGIEQDLREKVKDYTISFEGAVYNNRALVRQLSVILVIVFLLLFLILAAQFESLVQPILILIDVPLSLMGGLLMLWIFGASLNLVSMVGLIVTAGIIVNDAILKVDMINKNRAAGMDMDEAIIEASSRRLRPIVMTSLTTILAFMPVLFSSGLGAELQTPMALTIIGGLVIGTISSLIFLPVLYSIMIRPK